MPVTPDRSPGVSDEEGTVYEATTLATQQGEVRYDGSRFSMYDATGEFDPRGAGGKVKVSSNDALADYLLAKLAAGANITRTEQNDGGVETILVDADIGNVAAELFGDCDEDGTTSTTTSLTFVEKLKMTTPALESGDWLILYHATLFATAGNGRFEVRCQLDDTTDVGTLLSLGGGSDQQVEFAGHRCIVGLAAGVHEIDIDYRKAGGGGDVGINQARLAIWRIG